ncbi:MAG: helix-turn-helix domain-containing protein [Coriobacteriales bacterium]|jgi:transcriptional regulator with XRE-family HTH domain|nr:helix-turn-helix domain-containing protein [Coriobacteriales bacterium]
METKDVLAGLRKKNGLTQDAMAQQLYVTRQAVSRWETGETTPGIETLKLISQQFGVSIDDLLGSPEGRICQSCAMPLAGFDDLGSEKDGASVTYCVHCYKDGEFTHSRSLEEMVEANLRFLDEFNAQSGTSFSEDEAKLVLKTHLATLERWATQ